MKSILISFLVLISVSAFATNPQIRVCNITTGYFWSLDISGPIDNNIGFCKYNESLIGSITQMKYFFDHEETKAMNAFQSTKIQNIDSCEMAGAIEIISDRDDNGIEYSLCFFRSDFSFISKKSLTEGWASPFNEKLVKALSIIIRN